MKDLRSVAVLYELNRLYLEICMKGDLEGIYFGVWMAKVKGNVTIKL